MDTATSTGDGPSSRKKCWRAWCLCIAALAISCGQDNDAPPAPARGIVSFGPNITETIFALGEGDRIVGVTNFCDYPPEAAAKTRVGGYLDPDLEKITALAPELIILPGKMEKLATLAQQNRIPILNAHMDSLATIYASIRSIGAALGCSPKADELCARIEGDLDAVRESVKDQPRVKLLIINARQSHDLNNLFTVGQTSFISELADIAGGDAIFNDTDNPYFEASKETVVMRAPDVIIEFHAGENLTAEEQARYIADWNELAGLPAVRNQRVYLFLESYGLRPGPRVGLIAARLAQLLHHDAAASPQ
ncbi:MAG: helical backbone metal receptor [Candidatus Hydrogenedentes bacterium]|nr:helical backbone metal receptor [Candidatus Hydrogenedentota bacterium]